MTRNKRDLYIRSGIGAIVRAEYNESVNPAFQGNPCIAALPRRKERDEAMRLLRREIPYDPAVRHLSHIQRLEMMLSIQDYFEPLPVHIGLERLISEALELGLNNRNPLDGPSYWYKVDENKQLIVEELETSQNFDPQRYRTVSPRIGIGLIGDSGVGKSRSVEEILALLPQVILHQDYRGHELNLAQITYLRVECPANSSIKTLLLEEFELADEILAAAGIESNYFEVFARNGRASVDYMLGKFARLIGIHNIGVVVIDEVQRMVGSRDETKMMNFFETLINLVGVPVILIGTESARDLLSQTFSSGRRLTGHRGTVEWKRLQYGLVFAHFLESLWKYQYTSTDNPLTEGLKEAFYYETQGIIDLIVKLYMIVQFNVIEENERRPDRPEVMTPELVHRAGQKHFRHLQKQLKEMREGKEPEVAPEEYRRVDVAAHIRLDANDLISDHTVLPYYSAFMPDDRYEQIRQDMRGESGSGIHLRFGNAYRAVPQVQHLRYCPVCVDEDRQQYGEAYWHREHHLPGIGVCARHAVFLENHLDKLPLTASVLAEVTETTEAFGVRRVTWAADDLIQQGQALTRGKVIYHARIRYETADLPAVAAALDTLVDDE